MRILYSVRFFIGNTEKEFYFYFMLKSKISNFPAFVQRVGDRNTLALREWEWGDEPSFTPRVLFNFLSGYRPLFSGHSESQWVTQLGLPVMTGSGCGEVIYVNKWNFLPVKFSGSRAALARTWWNMRGEVIGNINKPHPPQRSSSIRNIFNKE